MSSKGNIVIVRGEATNANSGLVEAYESFTIAAQAAGYNVVIIGDGQTPVSLDTIQRSLPTSGPTQLFIDAHGESRPEYHLGISRNGQPSVNADVTLNPNAVTGIEFARSLPLNVVSVSYMTCGSAAVPYNYHQPGVAVYSFSGANLYSLTDNGIYFGQYPADGGSIEAEFRSAAKMGFFNAYDMHTLSLLTAITPLNISRYTHTSYDVRNSGQGEEFGISGRGIIDLGNAIPEFKGHGFSVASIQKISTMLESLNLSQSGSVLSRDQIVSYVNSISDQVKNGSLPNIRGTFSTGPDNRESGVSSRPISDYQIALALASEDLRIQGSTAIIEIPSLNSAALTATMSAAASLSKSGVTCSGTLITPDATGQVNPGQIVDVNGIPNTNQAFIDFQIGLYKQPSTGGNYNSREQTIAGCPR